MAALRGTVLEIGPGAGVNLPWFGSDVRWIGVEPDPVARDLAVRRASRLGRTIDLVAGPVENLDLPRGSVDAVVGTYVLCSVDDQAAALAEVRRVLVPGGRAVFVDHVVAPPHTMKRAVQRVVTPISRRCCHGCHWDRDTGAALVAAGFTGDDVRMVRVPSFPFGPTRVLLFDGHVAPTGGAPHA